MPPKKEIKKDQHVMIRIDRVLRQALEKEAEKDDRSLTSYIRQLITTHPRRAKK